jgi:peptidyl-prolyl cis-trans isomerase SurA
MAQAAPARFVDEIVAVVNDEAVTRHELDLRTTAVERQLRASKVQLPPPDVLRRQVLERLVTERVLIQTAARSGLRVDSLQLDRAMERVAGQNRMSLDAFRQALAAEGASYARLREDVRGELLIARMRERDADNKVVVTDAEVDSFIAAQAGRAGRDEYDYAHILLRAPDGASPEQLALLRAKTDKALADLRGGADFAQISAAVSDAPNALQGGGLGWKSSAQIPALFLDTLNALQPGQVSEPLKSAAGYHLLKLNDKRGANVSLVVTQTHARHILLKPSEIVSSGEARQRLATLKERIDNGASFAELARVHSEDGSAPRGGDLGWLNPGDTVPEFQRAMDELQPGEVGAPAQSPFGWHLIQVIERRSQDITEDRQKHLARTALRERKADEAFQDLARQLRDSAYVEIRLEE